MEFSADTSLCGLFRGLTGRSFTTAVPSIVCSCGLACGQLGAGANLKAVMPGILLLVLVTATVTYVIMVGVHFGSSRH